MFEFAVEDTRMVDRGDDGPAGIGAVAAAAGIVRPADFREATTAARGRKIALTLDKMDTR